jgi:hypothetical protein
VELPWPLKGLSKLDVDCTSEPEMLRDCMAVQPARATGSEWCVHERAIARVAFARAGIVDAAGGVLRWDGSCGVRLDAKFGKGD